MSKPERYEFKQYRGDGTTRDGRAAPLSNEEGRYFAGPEVVIAVNTMLAVEQPLLVTGEAGTGKTALAFSIAAELELGEVEKFAVRSDHQGRDVLYQFDYLRRFYHAQVLDPEAKDPSKYVELGPLGRAFESPTRRVVLIDEIDKGPRDFPNDLLDVLDRMELYIPETRLKLKAQQRPVVVVTSSPESRLPDAFLRRCIFAYIEFPEEDRLARILEERLRSEHLDATFRDRVVTRFSAVRKAGLSKLPATAELITWARALGRAGIGHEELEGPLGSLPLMGALCKSWDDLKHLKGVGT
ncbi:MAG TPA: MoxR family ATPase [Thermoanaerobaculia bacterium]|nr:MoxR family ATPase [Thermoanaerobaculia bacterium]